MPQVPRIAYATKIGGLSAISIIAYTGVLWRGRAAPEGGRAYRGIVSWRRVTLSLSGLLKAMQLQAEKNVAGSGASG